MWSEISKLLKERKQLGVKTHVTVACAVCGRTRPSFRVKITAEGRGRQWDQGGGEGGFSPLCNH